MALLHSSSLKKASTDAITAIIGDHFGATPNPAQQPWLRIFKASGSTTLASLLIGGEDLNDFLVGMNFVDGDDTNPFGAAASSGISTAAAVDNGTVENSGAAALFSLSTYDAEETFHIIAGTVGEAGDSPDITLNNKDLSVGQIIQITSLTYRAVPQ